MWISKKLRVDTYRDAHHNDAPFTGHVPLRKLRHDAADTIDAIVAALQNMVDADELTKDDYDQARAALALARGEG